MKVVHRKDLNPPSWDFTPQIQTERHKKELAVLAKRELKIRKSRTSLWEYCKTLSPDFYTDTRLHLVQIIDTLQKLYDGELLNEDGKPYKKLMMSIPPRHGKSRSLINFASWVLGRNNANRIITCSYNEELATDFSKYTRNTIQQTKERPEEIIYNDIFTKTKIKKGDASYKQWALDGQFFNYKGAGLGGTLTGKGATILIADDLIKDAATAYSMTALDSIWSWYTGTFLSRAEEGAIQILCMTRWSGADPIGRIMAGNTAKDWYIMNMEAYDEETDTMLCEDLLSRDTYNTLKLNMDTNIFEANYHNKMIDQANRLYPILQEYVTAPTFERIVSYTDTADTGGDYLASVIAGELKGQLYILDIYYTKEGMETTENEVAKRLFLYKVNTAYIESNNGGRGFARNIERLLWDTHKSRHTRVDWFHQSKNKTARILSNATNVMNNIFFPSNWRFKQPIAYVAMASYQREGKNKHDDLPDCITGIWEKIQLPTWVFLKGV